MCTNFQLKRTTLTFLAQIWPKRKLGFEIQETNVGIRISILKIPCVPIFRQNGQLWVFGPKFAQKWILGSKFEKSKSGFRISILEIPYTPIFRQNEQLWIFVPKFAQKWILGSEFQKSKSGFGIDSKCHGCQFSVKMDNIIFRRKFGEIAQLCAIFWFKYYWGGWSWVEVEMSWVELDGAVWRWVHDLVIPI